MSILEELLDIERGLSSADIALYEEVCRDDALFIMPGMLATVSEAIEGLKMSDPWDEFQLEHPGIRELGADAVQIFYRFTGRRGSMNYTADLSSTYVRRGDSWKLVVHQHTPVYEES